MNNKTKLARTLRKNLTKQELVLWQLLRNHKFFGYEIRRQSPIGKYIVDFVCREKKIIVEIDGGQHNETENREYDLERTKYLNNKGYKVVRFWNNDVDSNLAGVYEKLKEVFELGGLPP